MEWNMIFELIDPRLLIVLAACWVIGAVLKITPNVPDWIIVYAVIVVGVLLAIGILGWSVESLIQGILTGAFSVFGHQALKQTAKAVGGSNE